MAALQSRLGLVVAAARDPCRARRDRSALGVSLDVATPAAVVDLDRLESNLARWQEHCDRIGLANRPHVKSHKCIEIGRRQIALGAAGVTCQTLYEAEVMVDAGIKDVLLPYNIVGGRKLERLALLLERATVQVTVDDPALLSGLGGAGEDAGRELGVLVDCDTGLGRTGVASPEDAADLAAMIARTPGLRFSGLLTYPSPPGAREFFETASALLERRGLPAETVSAGGTPSMWRSDELWPVVTEYRVGTYAFHDRNTVAAGAATLGETALTVAATVVSRRDGRAILDAGSKALSSDLSAEDGFGLVLEAPLSTLERLNEEHGYLALAGGDDLELGQQVRVVPNHACVAVNLFQELVATRGGVVEARWPVERGR
jgi:D-serine deaminase-like pyridoxal phosphate-dependent protein